MNAAKMIPTDWSRRRLFALFAVMLLALLVLSLIHI